MRWYRLNPWSKKARARRRRLAAARAWQRHEREGATAMRLLMDQAAAIQEEPDARIYISSRLPDGDWS